MATDSHRLPPLAQITPGPSMETTTLDETAGSAVAEDVQVIPVGSADETDASPNVQTWSRGKKNFTRVALKVLSHVHSSKGRQEDRATQSGSTARSEYGLDSLNEYPKRLKDMGRARERSISQSRSERVSHTHASPSTNHTDPQIKRKDTSERRTPSMASVVSLATFRKLYMSKTTAPAQGKKPDGERKAEKQGSGSTDDDLLPLNPRFAATLSTEAQFAMLKGYEDKLLCQLNQAFPDQRPHMVRVRTPPSDRRISLPSGDIRSLDFVNPTTEPSDLRPPQPSQRRSLPEATSQLRVTGQLETAMDILDQLNGASGQHVISPRLRSRHRSEPVGTYNAWTHRWAKQFKVNNADNREPGLSDRHSHTGPGNMKEA